METVGISAASWVVGKALGPLSGGVLESWAASTKLGYNIENLKLELLQAQAMLNTAEGREIHNPALAELLNKLRQLAYGADDVLGEIDYFRIQDELDGTYHAADAHAAGCVQDLTLHARHMTKACGNKLKFPVCTRATRRPDPDEQDGDGKQGCLSGLRFCGGRREVNSSLPTPTKQLGVDEVHGRCMPKAAHNVVCGAIKSLSNGLPSSLEILNICRCDAIKSLPKDNLPSSMRELDVHLGNSKELKRDCRKFIGTIPIVRT